VPGSCNIAIVGGYYDHEEEKQARPFVGASGQFLDSLLADAGIQRSECFTTVVFKLRPGDNKLESLCSGPKDASVVRDLPALTKGKYLREEYAPELKRLYSELALLRPNIIVALGPVANWALAGNGAISKTRGTCAISPKVSGVKILGTHDQSTLKIQYHLRAVTVIDLIKAKRESEFPEIRRPQRTLILNPLLLDVEEFYQEHLVPARIISFDVETAAQQVTCISFAPSVDRCLVIPLMDFRFPEARYWMLEDEIKVWSIIRQTLALPCPKLGQNVLYDIQYLWRQHGIPVFGEVHDTMLIHHALYPESQKSLGFLGSVYTNETAWKPLRPKGKHNEKAEDSE
jgi:uracil-DNA glycosylase